jgi:cytochrome c oxidase assembly protein subunit 15
LTEEDWSREFDLYKETPQYQQINVGMSLKEFKFIYFWEFLHRFWARSIGIVFFVPFVFFVFKKWLDRTLYKELGIAVLLGALVAAFGWIMVASGLVARPWVNAYKLTIHLNLALLLYAWMFWVALGKRENIYVSPQLKRWLNILTVFIIVQFLFGGLMSGMKACLYYPTWPDMYGEIFPKILIDSTLWTKQSLIEYERGLVPGLVQFVHRCCAYIIFFITALMFWKLVRIMAPSHVRIPIQLLLALVIFQVVLGILTLINCTGKIPLFYGVAHQATAILLLSNLIYIQKKIHR